MDPATTNPALPPCPLPSGEDSTDPVEAPVPWTVDELKDVCEELIDALESWDKADDSKRARAKGLASELVRQIEADAGMPKFCKAIFKRHLPPLLVKHLNRMNISAENKDESACVLAVIYLVYDKIQRRTLIDKLSGQSTATQPKP